jgi:protocatechuate 3,4-dioxygenase beta subunit
MKKSLRAAALTAAVALVLTAVGTVPAYAKTETTGTVTVTVQAPGGAPLENVWVSVSGPGWASGSTTAQGTFSSGELTPGTYDITAELWTPVQSTQTKTVTIAANADSTATIEFPGVQVIKGSVTAGGKNVTSGNVTVYSSEGAYVTSAAVTSGAYQLLVKSGASYTVQASPDWSNPTKTWLSTYAGSTVREVDSTPVKVSASAPSTVNIAAYNKVGKISGRVVDASGKPAKNAYVSAYALNRAGSASVTTDAKGNYTLTGLPADSYNITASTSTTSSKQAKIKVSSGKTAKASLKLLKPKTYKSKVILTLKAPSALVKAGNACATLIDSKGYWAARDCLTGSEKKITFTNLAAGKYKIALDGANTSKSVTVKTSKTVKTSMTRAAGTTVSGKVTTSTGKALAKAWVYVTDGNDTSLRGVETDSKGRYKISGILKGSYEVQAAPIKASQGAVTTKKFASKGKKLTANVALKKGATITGKIVDSKGKPIAGVSVNAYSNSLWGANAMTNAKGVYVLEGLTAGKYTVATYDQYFGGYFNGKTTTSVSTGKKVTAKTIKLKG